MPCLWLVTQNYNLILSLLFFPLHYRCHLIKHENFKIHLGRVLTLVGSLKDLWGSLCPRLVNVVK